MSLGGVGTSYDHAGAPVSLRRVALWVAVLLIVFHVLHS
jgi:hypothetical protein